MLAELVPAGGVGVDGGGVVVVVGDCIGGGSVCMFALVYAVVVITVGVRGGERDVKGVTSFRPGCLRCLRACAYGRGELIPTDGGGVGGCGGVFSVGIRVKGGVMCAFVLVRADFVVTVGGRVCECDVG